MIRAGLFAALLALAGCAALPPPPAATAATVSVEAPSRFTVEARFALKVEKPGEAPQYLSGRLSWEHAADIDRLLLSNPLGQGVAELERRAGAASLKLADGTERQSTTMSSLLVEVLGVSLPVEKLPAWLLARPVDGEATRDALGRVRQWRGDGWQIDYDYDAEMAAAKPAKLVVRQGAELELRLRCESWR